MPRPVDVPEWMEDERDRQVVDFSWGIDPQQLVDDLEAMVAEKRAAEGGDAA